MRRTLISVLLFTLSGWCIGCAGSKQVSPSGVDAAAAEPTADSPATAAADPEEEASDAAAPVDAEGEGTAAKDDTLPASAEAERAPGPQGTGESPEPPAEKPTDAEGTQPKAETAAKPETPAAAPDTAPLAKAPEPPPAEADGGTKTETAAAPGPSLAGAKSLWKSKCAKCHGKAGAAETKIAKKKKIRDMTTAQWQNAVSDGDITAAILKGVKKEIDGKQQKMKALTGATQAKAKELLALIRSWK